MNPATPFDAWIDSKGCWELILKCCKKQTYNSLQTGSNHLKQGIDETADLAADLWIHLRGKKSGFKSKVADILSREDWPGLQRYMMSVTRSFVLEQNRDKYYQRVRQSLSEEKSDIGYLSSEFHASYGSTAEHAEIVLSYHDLVSRGFQPHFPKVPFEDLKKAKAIVHLATALWKQVEEYLKTNIRIPIRELCAFIREGWPEATRYGIETEQLARVEGDEELSESDMLTMANIDHSHDSITSEEKVNAMKGIADRIALKLDDQQLLLVLCLKKYCDMPHKEIARILGLSGPSHVDYWLRKAFQTLEPLLSQEDGLSPEDLDQNLFELFWKLLLDNCKDEDCYRSSQELER